MSLLIGIKEGECAREKMGTTRHEVVLHPQGDFVRIDDRRIGLHDDTLVFLHRDSAGTFHGIFRPGDIVDKQTAKSGGTLRVGNDVPGVISASSSGMGEAVAIVAKVTEPISIVTSGYAGRRGWEVLTVTPAASGLVKERIPLSDFLSKKADVETL